MHFHCRSFVFASHLLHKTKKEKKEKNTLKESRILSDIFFLSPIIYSACHRVLVFFFMTIISNMTNPAESWAGN